MEHLLDINSLAIGFGDRKTQKIFTDYIDFHVKKGEVLGIVGESGCGKSITALSIMKLLSKQGQTVDGKIMFHDTELGALTERELDKFRGDKISMIFQDSLASLNPVFTIGNQLIESIRSHHKVSRKEAKARAVELIRQMGIADPEKVIKKYPHELSGGMRQRVMIAMALSGDAELLIADEPTTALDVTIQAQIMRLIKRIQKKRKLSMILITHDIGLIAEMADRVIVMYAGQIIEEANVYEIFEHPTHPYTRALLDATPSIMDTGDKQLNSIKGVVPENYTEIIGCRFADRCPYACKDCAKAQAVSNIGNEHFVRCQRAEQIDIAKQDIFPMEEAV